MKRYRKPSFKKSFSARTTGKMTRTIKKTYMPNYGRKGNGWVTNPKKATYNHVYNQTTQSIHDNTTSNSHWDDHYSSSYVSDEKFSFLGFIGNVLMGIAFILKFLAYSLVLAMELFKLIAIFWLLSFFF